MTEENEYTFQKASPCDFCENPAQFHCQNCEDALCNKCREKHDKKKKHHKVVLYSARVKSVCVIHPEHKYVYWCKTCDATCCTKCATTSHQGHKLEDIENAIRTKKHSLGVQLDRALSDCLTKWKDLVQDSRQITSEFTDDIDKIDGELVSHADKIHKAVDEILTKTRGELRAISESTKTILQEQESTTEKMYKEFQRRIEHLEELRQSDDIGILQEPVDIDELTTLPSLARHSPPSYSLGQIDDQTIAAMIGKLKAATQNTNHRQSSQNRAMSLCKAEILSSFNPRYDYPYIACTASTFPQVWMKTAGRQIRLIDRYGVVQDTIDTAFEFNDVTVTPHGEVIFADVKCRIVLASKTKGASSKGANSWAINKLFSTQDQPMGLCYLRNDNVVVTFYLGAKHRVIQYNRAGVIIHEFHSSLFLNPDGVAVNKVNDDLYICNPDKVLAFSTDHVFRYEYTGSNVPTFTPCAVATDLSGHVLITDLMNDRIHILDKEGKFLQYLQHPNIKAPYYIDVDTEENAWVGEYKGRVNLVQYLK